jgi:hypothetical protein
MSIYSKELMYGPMAVFTIKLDNIVFIEVLAL